ncbi:hypothetical protein cypCar_00015839 [Cyprinus carpio]|nr:hypothetical protein cypCar_00015839 [Cyprinus carpio]
MLLAQINQSADFQHEGDAQEVTLCLTETVGIADGDQSMDTVSLQAVTLADGSTAYIPHNTQESNIVEGQVIQLEDGSSAYVQHIDVPKADESNNWTGSSVCDVVGNESLRLEDAQTVQLEDGTTAYIHHTGKDTYEPSTLQAVQLEDGSTAYIHHAVQMSQPNTILAIQTNSTVADLHTDATIDQETINALEQYTTKIEEMDSYTNSELITSDPHSVVEMQIVLQGQGIRRNAQQPGEKCFRCNYDGCGKLYTTANHLKVHERAHTGDKPYCCDLPGCGKRFATGERPYVCTVPGCDKRFTEYSSLYKHNVVHTPCKPYKCNHCGKAYKQISTLVMHKRTAHNDSEPIEEESEGYFEPPSEAIDDPSLTVSPVKCEDSCPEMDPEISDVTEQHVTFITQDGASQAIGNVITMVTQDGSVITIPPTESLLSSAEAHSVTVLSEDGTEGQMTAMIPELSSSRSMQHELSAHPITLLATSNGTQIAVQV